MVYKLSDAEAEVLNAFNTSGRHEQSNTIVHGLLLKMMINYDYATSAYRVTRRGLEALQAYVFEQPTKPNH